MKTTHKLRTLALLPVLAATLGGCVGMHGHRHHHHGHHHGYWDRGYGYRPGPQPYYGHGWEHGGYGYRRHHGDDD